MALVTSVQNNVSHVKTSGVMAPMKRPDSRLYAGDLRSEKHPGMESVRVGGFDI